MTPEHTKHTDAPFDRSETFSHCRRVSALARRTAAQLNLGEDIESALGIAGSLHHFCGPRFTEGRLTSLFGEFPELAAARPAGNDILRLAERILIRFPGRGRGGSEKIDVASAALEAANEFDETVEFAALGGDEAGEDCATAIREFREEDCSPRSARAALCKVTEPPPFTLDKDHLPVLPKAASKLLRMTDETAPAALESVVAWDPILTARLLEIANSAAFGPARSIGRLADAAARVGIPTARKVLLAAVFGEVFASASLRTLWVNSQRIAEKTSALARLCKVDTEEAYVAGLLHDAGRFVLERANAASRVAVAGWLSSGFPLTYAEALVYAQDHAKMGAELLRSWELPENIVEAVEYHHRPERSHSVLTSLVFLAEQWHSLKFGGQDGFELNHDLHQKMRCAYAAKLTGITDRNLGETDVAHLLAAAN